ncbi:MAG: T9SS type A sorting domain-containing protein [Ignavibacteriaceae bacterium]|jgi:ligand-binding sensor domain-containing protein|nr:T9SS type A sorting domain-containing protein [Ignavibacteriaceae bacterium]HPO54914.1 T9SS type A sorting domain-containing protein [Ignavibacteriaceae bacterium]
MKISLFLVFLLSSSFLFTQSWNKVISNAEVIAVDSKLNQVWAATDNNGVFYLNKNSGIWRNYTSENGYMVTNSTDGLVIATGKVFIASTYGIYYCGINGNNWGHYVLPGGYMPNWIRAVADDDTVVWFGTFQGIATYSKNSASFKTYNITKNSDGSTNNITTIHVTPNEVWFGTENGVQVYKKGLNITADSSRFLYNKQNGFDNLSQYISVKAIAVQDTIVWIGLEDYTPASNPNYCKGGLYRFNRNANVWQRFDKSTGLSGNGIHFIRINSDSLIAGLFTYINGVSFTGNGLLKMNTANLNSQIINYSSHGVGDSNYFDLRTLDNELWLAAGDGLYTTYDTTATSVENNNNLPDNFVLYQNYPNPFNPETIISFHLPANTHVSLKLFDILGNEIAQLVDETIQAGLQNYRLTSHNHQLSAGVYFYQLRAGDLISTKKMILLK